MMNVLIIYFWMLLHFHTFTESTVCHRLWAQRSGKKVMTHLRFQDKQRFIE